jgi:hypothetical protein
MKFYYFFDRLKRPVGSKNCEAIRMVGPLWVEKESDKNLILHEIDKFITESTERLNNRSPAWVEFRDNLIEKYKFEDQRKQAIRYMNYLFGVLNTP